MGVVAIDGIVFPIYGPFPRALTMHPSRSPVWGCRRTYDASFAWDDARVTTPRRSQPIGGFTKGLSRVWVAYNSLTGSVAAVPFWIDRAAEHSRGHDNCPGLCATYLRPIPRSRRVALAQLDVNLPRRSPTNVR